MFPESFLTELTEKNDIVEVVGSFVNLNKRSGSNYFGLCPFHNEKTPSFSVSPSKQIYYCFGCGKGGGVINFIMEEENMSYPEAIGYLAKRVGMTVPEDGSDRESKKKSRMYALNKDAARFFHDMLVSDSGDKAKAYMAKRKISPQIATRFGLGFAPDTWDSLKNAMHEKGYSDFEMFDAGLLKQGKNGSYYDAFRDRLMFPVIDVRGNVIGFSGRMLGNQEPKYLNSPQTVVFDKGKNLFGLNLAKKSKSGRIILVEGNIDVVSLHQAGFDCAVASLGTSLTPDQARLLSRYTKEVVIAYDADGAGLKASQRAIDILETLDVKVKVLRMNGAKDPDEYIKANGAGAFQNLIDQSASQIDFRIGELEKKFDLSIPEQKAEFAKESVKMIATFSNKIEREVYAMRVAEKLGIKNDSMISEVELQRKRLEKSAKIIDNRDKTPVKVAQPTERELRYDDIESAKAEEGVIRILYLEPEIAESVTLETEDFTSPQLGHIYEVIKTKAKTHTKINVTTLAEDLSQNEMNLLIRITQTPEKLSSASTTINDYINKIVSQKEKKTEDVDLRDLARKLKDAGKGYKQSYE